MAVSSGAGKVFGWCAIFMSSQYSCSLIFRFVNMTSIAGLMSWFGISVTYLRWYKGLKSQSYDRASLPYRSPYQPFAAWYGLWSCLVVCIVSGSFAVSRCSIHFMCFPLSLVQRLGSIFRRFLGNRHICYDLPPTDPVSYLLRRSPILVQIFLGQA